MSRIDVATGYLGGRLKGRVGVPVSYAVHGPGVALVVNVTAWKGETRIEVTNDDGGGTTQLRVKHRDWMIEVADLAAGGVDACQAGDTITDAFGDVYEVIRLHDMAPAGFGTNNKDWWRIHSRLISGSV